MFPIRSCLLVLGALHACTTQPAAPPMPTVHTAIDWQPGTPLGGAIDARFAPPFATSARPDTTKAATIEFASLAGATAPADANTIDDLTRLVLRDNASVPIGGIPTILPRLLIVHDGQAKQYVETALPKATTPKADSPPTWQKHEAALPANSTATLTLQLHSDDSKPASQQLQVSVGHLDHKSACVVISADNTDDSAEHVLLTTELQADSNPIVLYLPFAAGAALRVQLFSREASKEQLAQAKKGLAAAVVAAEIHTPQPAELEQLTFDTEADSFLDQIGGRLRRTALLALTRRFEAPFCGDLALIADDATLISLTQLLPKDLTKLDPAQTRLALEISAFRSVEQRLQEFGLPPQLLAWIVRQAGAAGRSRASLDPVLRDCTSTEQLKRRLLIANYGALDDGDPSSRVLASDWLTRRGISIAGYDPLGEPRERRNALTALRQQLQREATR
ncbi:MAG: hypothetical protein VYE77_09280 [Planctomycetota bacterium]|nr:hypothetical protein [Planctomycetota bacterium]